MEVEGFEGSCLWAAPFAVMISSTLFVVVVEVLGFPLTLIFVVAAIISGRTFWHFFLEFSGLGFTV